MKMPKSSVIILVSLIILSVGVAMLQVQPVQAGMEQQQPTVAVATVTGTDTGPIATVNLDNDQINLRSGPGTEYELVGVLVSGQSVPAIGRSAGGLWIQIRYAGVESGVAWVYSPLVTVTRVTELDIVEPPAQPTPKVTPTIDPTLASQFIEDVPATRLPTFTAAPPLIVPTFQATEPVLSARTFPVGIIVVALGLLGLLAGAFSLVFRR